MIEKAVQKYKQTRQGVISVDVSKPAMGNKLANDSQKKKKKKGEIDTV